MRTKTLLSLAFLVIIMIGIAAAVLLNRPAAETEALLPPCKVLPEVTLEATAEAGGFSLDDVTTIDKIDFDTLEDCSVTPTGGE